ncbi:ABC transporter ATP-binding protein, partial [Klebsiella pneumoniae]|uniref:ABC transporter ATP-binding protein n=1 Tax=Klebsiella pneumoniae TaxID=573 RepID=UPI003F67F1A8
MTGDGDFLAPSHSENNELWPTGPAAQDYAPETGDKGFVARMTRVPENAVQQALAGKGRKVTSLLKPVAWMFVIAALLIALDSAAGVGVLILLQRGIDSGVAAGDMSTIGLCVLLALCLVAVSWSCYSLQTVFAARAAESVQHTVRVRTFGHMLRLGLPWHEKHVDSRLTRMTVDVDSLARFLQNGLAGAATSLVTMFAIAAAMFWLDPLLALTALSAVPQVALATWIYRRLSSPAYAQARLEIGKVNSTLQEKVSGLRVVQSHGQQEQEAARLRALSDRFRTTRVRAQKYLAVYFPFLTFCTEASYAAVLLILLQRGIDSGVAAGDMSTIGLCVLLALCLVAVSWSCYSLQTVFAARAAESVQHTVRVRTFGHMLRLGLPWHEKHVDSRLTRMTVDVDSLARFLQNGLAGAATSLVTMFAIAAAMFWLDPLLALTALSAVPQVALATWIYRRLSSPAYAQARLEIGKVNSTLQEKVSGLRVVQSHGQQEQEAARLRALSDRFRTTRVRAQKYLAVYFPFLTFCTEASYAAVLLVGASRVAEGEMTAGVMAAFYLLLGQFYGPVQQLSGIVDAWQQAT